MAFADDDPPLPSADLDHHPVGEPPKARRHRRDAAAVAVLPLAEELARRRVEPGATGEIAAQRREILGAAAHHRAYSHSFSVIHNGACQRSVSQPAKPIWSGW